jgi:hypothetical protein
VREEKAAEARFSAELAWLMTNYGFRAEPLPRTA